MPKLDLGLPSYDSLFSTEEERQEANSEKVMTIPIDKITDFKEHPFHTNEVTELEELMEIKQLIQRQKLERIGCCLGSSG